MDVIGFVGPSGTGKSHHALVVAYDRHIDAFIDDGLLIYHNRIIAGHSAKDEPNRLRAVRCAIFSNPEAAAVMREALRRIKAERLLILGTSKHMVECICKTLTLPMPVSYVTIEEVSTAEEMAKAREQRLKAGRHIIPVPTVELKSHFRGYLLDSVRSFFSRNVGNEESEFERSVVRPVFSYYGKLIFSDNVLLSLVRHTVGSLQGVVKINRLRVRKNGDSHSNGLNIELALTVQYGENIKRLMSRLRKEVEREIVYTTGMTVEVLKITVRDVAVKE
ncbi:Asp23/Gls24 family envelope stress response protein [Colibacter massiliensis]|uniref:Asp23/Gls24 family envelope stress response protein n=1 Tax=Colibacter massiliensis TaxID=1852379 RepID=UPI00266CAA6A|nr:Asp23/Gls24 family envelope stress response protein [Colibacter massiliensis]